MRTEERYGAISKVASSSHLPPFIYTERPEQITTMAQYKHPPYCFDLFSVMVADNGPLYANVDTPLKISRF
jgi:hypothetical protein